MSNGGMRYPTYKPTYLHGGHLVPGSAVGAVQQPLLAQGSLVHQKTAVFSAECASALLEK